MIGKYLLFVLLAFCALAAASGQSGPAQKWTARWIDVPGSSPYGYGVYHFRRSFELSSEPQHFTVWVSADNRYQLFVNGKRVALGPARGDLTHWRYETVDIAPELKRGRNVLAAVVWNDGPYRAIAQITNQTAFLLQAEDPANNAVDSNRSWKSAEDKAYTPLPLPVSQTTGYYALAANEKVDGRLYPWGWESQSFDDGSWVPAHELTRAASRDAQDSPNRWMLVPSRIPLEEQKPERLLELRRSEGVKATARFLSGDAPISIPAHSQIKLLLDQTFLTTAYPELEVSGGSGAAVTLRYAESLYSHVDPPKHEFLKGDRNDIEGKQLLGPADTFIADGGAHRIYRTLFWRTYRYLEVTITTAGEPLTLEDLKGTFTAYPFVNRASISVDNKAADRELQQILATGWRTARLCAHETYMDCPFYEQLQYAGDARIQMLVSIYMTGDARLMKNGIALLDASRTAEGATYSRAPSDLQQYIPPFSLWWIGMVHDYWMFVDDTQFVRSMLPGVRAVLEFYAAYRKETGSLRAMPWWNFVDWAKDWKGGVPPGEADGSSSAPLDLQLLLAYRWAANLERHLGHPPLAEIDESQASLLAKTIVAQDWDAGTGLFADEPGHRTYSQQTNTLAVLAGIAPEGRGRSIVEKLIAPPGTVAGLPRLTAASIYFRAYLNAALREVGLGDRYMDLLGPWREMLGDGLTTWAEWSGPDARSDCHAWGSSPNFEFLRTVGGIDSLAPGFKRVRIAPNLGTFQQVNARMPHPRGEISLKLQRRHGLEAEIDLPAEVDGEFEWQGSKYNLHPGRNRLDLP